MLNAMTGRTEPHNIKWEVVSTVMMALRPTFLAAFRAVIGASERSACECMIDGVPGAEFLGGFFSSNFLTLRNSLGILSIPVFPVPFFGCFSMRLSGHLSPPLIRFLFIFSHLSGISAPPFSLVFGRGV